MRVDKLRDRANISSRDESRGLLALAVRNEEVVNPFFFLTVCIENVLIGLNRTAEHAEVVDLANTDDSCLFSLAEGRLILDRARLKKR